MRTQTSGYREIEHTADWALEVWAPDLPTLFEQAARGMYALAEVSLEAGPRQTRRISLQAGDPESLLVAFLSELVYVGEQEGLGFHSFDLELQGVSLRAELQGAPIASQKKEIKAVTYHNLEVKTTPRGLEVQIVFDV